MVKSVKFCAVALGITCAASPAFADGLDLTPVATQVIAVAFSVLAVAASVVSKFAISWLASKVKMQDSAFEALASDRVNAILQQSINYAEMMAKRAVADPQSPLKNIEINNFFLDQALRYAMRSMPDLVSYFQLTDDRIRQMIMARLNNIIPIPKPNSGSMSTITLTDAPEFGNMSLPAQ